MLIERAIVALAFALFAGFEASAKAGEDLKTRPVDLRLGSDLPDDWEALILGQSRRRRTASWR